MFGQSQPDFSQWLACSPVTAYGDVGSNRDPSAPQWLTPRPVKDPNWLTLEVNLHIKTRNEDGRQRAVNLCRDYRLKLYKCFYK